MWVWAYCRLVMVSIRFISILREQQSNLQKMAMPSSARVLPDAGVILAPPIRGCEYERRHVHRRRAWGVIYEYGARQAACNIMDMEMGRGNAENMYGKRVERCAHYM